MSDSKHYNARLERMVKLSLWLIKFHTMKMYEGVRV